MNKEKKIIFLLDLDSFFANCHIAIDPSLKDKNLVIASPNKRSIISTASYNARKFGISAGMPIFKAEQLCSDLKIVKNDFSLYIKYSHWVFDVISKNFTEKIEVASIDECYIDVTEIWKKYSSVKKLAKAMQDKIYQETGLTASIGISTNKFLAKTCVSFKKPNGISILLPEKIKEILWPLEIRKMHMIGPSTEKTLNANKIFTIKQIAEADVNKLQELLGKRGYVLWNWANGKGSDVVQIEQNELKSIGNELTLNFSTNNPAELENILYELCLKVSDRAKKRYLKGQTISVILKYKRDDTIMFNKEKHKKVTSKQETLPRFTNDVSTIFSSVKKNFYDFWKGQEILLIGVRLSKLRDEINNLTQLSINDINTMSYFEVNEIESIIKKLELQFGSKKIFTGKRLLEYNDKNRGQSRYLKNDDIHISNDDIIKKWKKNRKGD